MISCGLNSVSEAPFVFEKLLALTGLALCNGAPGSRSVCNDVRRDQLPRQQSDVSCDLQSALGV